MHIKMPREQDLMINQIFRRYEKENKKVRLKKVIKVLVNNIFKAR